ncbi:MAG: putative Zn finger protein [Phenylobacterium sp.]|jgi:uncharacterized Zn finger protein
MTKAKTINKTINKTWWGQNFMAALADFTDEGRLTRGRAYRSDKRIKKWTLKDGQVAAKVLGNANPYFGVTVAPTYDTSLTMIQITPEQWTKVIDSISENAGFICKLMMNEMPDDIEQSFALVDRYLLPTSYYDFRVRCSCPDTEVPCKHIAGVCYRLAGLLDKDPFLLFELRGLSRKKLHQALARSPLGKSLLQSLLTKTPPPVPRQHYFTQPEVMTNDNDMVENFWHGEIPLPQQFEPVTEAAIPAMMIKKGGDYPAFWHRDNSFIDAMEVLYLRLRKNGQKLL